MSSLSPGAEAPAEGITAIALFVNRIQTDITFISFNLMSVMPFTIPSDTPIHPAHTNPHTYTLTQPHTHVQLYPVYGLRR